MEKKLSFPLYNIIKKLYNKKIDATGLAIFRIIYGTVLLGEIVQIFYFRQLIFDNIPFIEPGAINPTAPMIIWMVSVLMLIFGFFTKIGSIVNYTLSLVFIGAVNSFEYHMFYAYMGANFLLMFLPVSACFSFDNLRKKLKYSNTTFQYNPPNSVTVLAYYVPVFVCIGFVYFDSIFFKLTSKIWLHGLGMWVPSSLPMFTQVNGSFVLNNEFLVKFLGYLTLIFESVFIFLFWFRKSRIPLMIIGIGLHLGILVEFPIPFFALGVSAIYLLMVPVCWWRRIFPVRRMVNPTVKVYYDMECPLCVRTKIVIEHFDAFKKVKFLSVQGFSAIEPALKDKTNDELLNDIYCVDKNGKIYSGVRTYIRIFRAAFFLKALGLFLSIPGITYISERIYGYVARNRSAERCSEANCGYTPPVIPFATSQMKIFNNLSLSDFKIIIIASGIMMLSILQLNVTYNSALVLRFREFIGIDKILPGKIIGKLSHGIVFFSKSYLGITSHAVFMDFHFANYNHIVSIVYKPNSGEEVYLPIIDRNGMPSTYIYGPNWVKWTFRVNSPKVDMAQLEAGIQDFTAFWAYKNNINLDNATFEIRVKKVDIPVGWQRDFLETQIQHPWIPAGEVKWVNHKFEVIKCLPIESI